MAYHGAKSSITTSQVQLTEASNPLQYGVEVRAAAANTGKVHIGFASTVTANADDATDGMELSAGECKFLPRALVDNTNDVWLIATAAGQKVFWLGV